MASVRFFPGFGMTTALVGGLIALYLYLLPELSKHLPFIGLSFALFAALALAIYFSAQPAAEAENPARLAQYVMVLTFVKMLLAAGLVFAYYKLYTPDSRLFLLPFFTAYALYTGFETIWLVRLNKQVSTTNAGKA